MQRIREILLTQYIGAIVIALLALDAIVDVIQVCGQAISYAWWSHQATGGSVLNPSTMQTRLTESLIANGVRAVLYLIASYALLHWLYLKDSGVEEPAEPEVNVGEAN